MINGTELNPQALNDLKHELQLARQELSMVVYIDNTDRMRREEHHCRQRISLLEAAIADLEDE